MDFDETEPIVIAGAGAVGCYVGGCLARAGRNVTLLLRAPLAETMGTYGLRISSFDSGDDVLPPTAFKLDTSPHTALAAARLVLLTVKSRDTDAMAQNIARWARHDCTVICMQNGVTNANTVRKHTALRQVIPAMVPFNVVATMAPDMAPVFHRATSGTIQIGAGTAGLAEFLNVAGANVHEHADIDAVLWAKLVLNMNNAINALCGQPLAAQLADRRWRRLLAQQMREALAVLRRAGIRPARIEGVNPRIIPLALRLPDRLFKIAARGMLRIDPKARSSMAADLERGRPTEIDQFQGAVLDLAARHGIETPITHRVVEWIKECEQSANGLPCLEPIDIERGPGGELAAV